MNSLQPIQIRRWLSGLLISDLNRFQAIVDGYQRLQNGPAIPGYESHFAGLEFPANEARLLGFAVVRLGLRFHEEELAGRKASSALLALTQNDRPLVASRRAQRLRDLCRASSTVEVVVVRAFLAAGESDFHKLLEGAIRGDAQACMRLVRKSSDALKHLPEPKGRKPQIHTSSHRFFDKVLAEVGQKGTFTYNDAEGGYTDERSLATRAAFALSSFDPRPALRPRSR
jgi:hypothetical protein